MPLFSCLRRPHLALLPALLAAASSCNFLQTKPEDFVTPTTYYSTETQLNNALTGVYDDLGKNAFYASVYPTVFASTTDESLCNAATSVSQIHFYAPTAADAANSALWAQLFEGINRANQLLANMDRATGVSAVNMRHIRGEAKFLRAYYYFILAQWWGDVPLRTSPTLEAADGQRAFTPAKDVYNFVIQEMTEANALLRDQKASTLTNNERLSNTTVQGILARVCLYAAGNPINDTQRYTQSVAWADSVVNSGQHKLNPDFKQVFINMSADAYDLVNRESMWEVGFYYNSTASTLREASQANIGIPVASTNTSAVALYGQLTALVYGSAVLYKAYPSTVTSTTDVSPDLRRDWTLAPFSYSTPAAGASSVEVPLAIAKVWGRASGKWRRMYEPTPRNATDSGRNWPILRYADVLLMQAEAENEVNGPTGKAYAAVNQVRQRAYAAGTALAVYQLPPGLSKADFRTAIQNERLRELAFEGLRRQDLKRWNLLVSQVQNIGMLATSGGNGIPAATTTTSNYGSTDAIAQAIWTQASSNVDVNDNLLPIPNTELVNNRQARQNPGY